jgi:two-component system sensor histidine kinase RpfC
MNLTAAWRTRLWGQRAEFEHALLRVWNVVLLTVVVWMTTRLDSANGNVFFAGMSSWLVLSIAIWAAVWVWPVVNTARRLLGMFVDVGAITFSLFYAGAGNAVLGGFYLFVIFGYGFRYGRAYLIGSQVLCLIGFSIAVFTAPWWRQQDAAVWSGWMLTIFIVPYYVGAFVERLKAERVRAETALKECVERQRSAPQSDRA